MDREKLEVPESRASCSEDPMACSDVVSTTETSTLFKKYDLIFITKVLLLKKKKKKKLKIHTRIDVNALIKIVNGIIDAI